MKLKLFKLLVILLTTGVSLSAQVQMHSWANSFTGSGKWRDQHVYAVTTVGTTTYVGGTYSGSMTLNGYTVNESTDGSAFIAKFNSTTGVCTGVTAFGSGLSNVKAIALIGSALYFTGSVDGLYYMGKLSTAFTNGAAVNIEVLDAGEGRGLAVSGSVVFVTGMMEQSMTFNPSAGTPIVLAGHTSYRSMFVAKFSIANFGTGVITYDSGIEPFSSSAAMEANGIAFYNSRLYITGYFKGTAKMTSTSTTMTASGISDLFVATVLNGSPALSFAANGERYGGSSTAVPVAYTGDAEYIDAGYGIAVNGNGIFVVGSTTGNCTFDAVSNSTSNRLNSVLVRYPLSSNLPGAASWVNVGASGNSTGKCFATSIALMSTDRIIVGGVMDDASGTLYGQGGTSQSFSSSAVNGTVASYSQSTGNLQWAFSVGYVGSPNFYHRVYAVSAASTCGRFWYGGSIRSTAKAGNITVPFTAPPVAAHTECFVAAANATVTTSSNVSSVCPGVNATLTATNAAGATYGWSPGTGLSCTSCQSPTFNYATPGTYTYVVTTTSGSCTVDGVVTATVITPIVANAGPDIRLCHGPALLGTPAQAGATYSWSPGTNLSCTTCARPTVSGSGGTYTLTVVGNCGTTTDVVNIYPYDAVICNSGTCTICNGYETGRYAAPEPVAAPAFQVFPNPADGIFNVSFGTDEERVITVFDLTGREVFRLSTQQPLVQLDLSAEGTGIYVLKVTEGGTETIRKIVVE